MNSGIQFWGLFSTMYFYPLGTETYHQVHFWADFCGPNSFKRIQVYTPFHGSPQNDDFQVRNHLLFVNGPILRFCVCGQFWGGYKVGPYQL